MMRIGSLNVLYVLVVFRFPFYITQQLCLFPFFLYNIDSSFFYHFFLLHIYPFFF